MTAPPKPENQHYIPKLMLRLFGHGDGKDLIWAHDKTTDCLTKRSVNRSASAPDYYAVNYPDLGRDVELERVFGRLETISAPLIKWMGALAPGPYELDAATRDVIASWLALSHARVPASIDQTFALAAVRPCPDAHRCGRVDPVSQIGEEV
ncbi:MAG: DUF4238 domain-containing protein [Candidatus Limnocylindrales bacterium]